MPDLCIYDMRTSVDQDTYPALFNQLSPSACSSVLRTHHTTLKDNRSPIFCRRTGPNTQMAVSGASPLVPPVVFVPISECVELGVELERFCITILSIPKYCFRSVVHFGSEVSRRNQPAYASATRPLVEIPYCRLQ